MASRLDEIHEQIGLVQKRMKMMNLALLTATVIVTVSASAEEGNERKALGPPALKISCGDVLLRIDGPLKWTINRIEYKGTPLAVENSAYGTVFLFPGIGFIGSGHLLDRQDGAEDVLSLEMELDNKQLSWAPEKTFSSKQLQPYLEHGRPLPEPVELVKGTQFKQHKISRILDFSLDCVIELRGNRLYEETTFNSPNQVPLELVYNFMHAWIDTATAFLSGKDGGDETAGELKDSKEAANVQYINKEMDWVAVYDGPSGKGAVSRLLAKPQLGGAVMFIRNCPKIYRKFYLMSFTKETVPTGFSGTYRMVTAFFEASSDKWQGAARKLAGELKAP